MIRVDRSTMPLRSEWERTRTIRVLTVADAYRAVLQATVRRLWRDEGISERTTLRLEHQTECRMAVAADRTPRRYWE